MEEDPLEIIASADRPLRTAAIATALLGLLFTTNPLTTLFMRGGAAPPWLIASRGFAAPLQLVCIAGAAGVLSHLLRERAEKTGLAGAILLVFGGAVGIRINVLGQIESLLLSGAGGASAEPLSRAFAAAPAVWVSIVPVGLTFPLSLMLLGSALFVTRSIDRPVAVMLIAGGLLFPVGRIGHLVWAYTGSDLLLGIAFACLAWRVLARPGTHAPETPS
jgi:hypothetical protein